MGTDVHPYVELRRNGVWEHQKQVNVPRDRNYTAFGKLANVRNGTGFAGCDMGDAVRPISEPRGIPKDTSIIVNEIEERSSLDYVSLGDHSFSWVTLEELLAVNYNDLVTIRGMVSKEQYEHWLKYNYPPREYCGWCSDPTYRQIEWQQPLMEVAQLMLKWIGAVCHLGRPEDVRIVFGFDS